MSIRVQKLQKRIQLPDAFHDSSEDVAAVESCQANEQQIEAIDQLLSGQNEAKHDISWKEKKNI